MLARLTDLDIKKAYDLLDESCSLGLLENILSSEDVYLGFQSELLNIDKKKRKEKIIKFIIYLLGDNLLNLYMIREAISKYNNLNTPEKWKPGSSAAISYCKEIKIPAVFAGTLPAPKQPIVERITNISSEPLLTDFQEEVFRQALETLNNNKTCLIALPTGAGKTLVATNIVLEWFRSIENPICSIWVAHSEELCEQAVECLKQTWKVKNGPSPITIYRAWGSNINKILNGEIYQEADIAKNVINDYSIVVTTPQTANNLLSSNIEGSLGNNLNHLGLMIIDEAHRAASDSYKKLIHRSKIHSKNIKIVGLSATPVRATYSSKLYDGTIELSNLFDELIEPINTLGIETSPIEALQNRGVLAYLDVKKIGKEELSNREISDIILAEHKTTNSTSLVFTNTVSSSKVIATYLRSNGLNAEFISAKSSSSERLNIINAMKNGKIDILCNCELLTTGFDAPSVDRIYLARYTNSPVLYKQIVGRGLRGPLFGGSERCTLILCGIDLPFDPDPNTSEFARRVWDLKK